MRRGRIGADDDDDVGVLDRVEVLCAGRGAIGLAEAIAGRRVTDARAGVDVVVAEAGADQLLHQEGFFIGAARRRDAADGVPAILTLDAPEFGGRIRNGLVPAHFLPRVGDLLADHRFEDTLAVRRIAPGKAAFYARMSAVGFAILVGDHAHDLFA